MFLQCISCEIKLHALTSSFLGLDTTPTWGLVIVQEGEIASAIPECIIAACGQVGQMDLAFEAFDTFFQDLRLPLTADTYAAAVSGCIENDLLTSVPLVGPLF